MKKSSSKEKITTRALASVPSSKAKPSTCLPATVPPNDIIQRIVYKPPTEYVRLSDVIPFHIPHKKLFEKYRVSKREAPESLLGLADNQNSRKRISQPTLGDGDIPRRAKVKELKIGVKIKTEDTKEKLEDFRHRNRLRPEISNQLELFDLVRTDPTIGFRYMIYGAPTWSEYYTPYGLKVVSYQEIDKKNFLTISCHGVTHYKGSDINFTPLDIWESEYYKQYVRLLKINLFSIFCKWNCFYVWKKNLSWRKFVEARDKLGLNLFILSPILRKTLLQIRALTIKRVFPLLTDISVNVKSIPCS